MARKRMIDPGFWDDEDVGQLTNDERLLFLGCISNADCFGKLTGSPASLKKMVFGFCDTSSSQVGSMLSRIHNTINGFHCYTVNGKPYIALLHWHRYQKYDNPAISVIPDPDDAEFDPPHPKQAPKPAKSRGNREDVASESRDSREASPNPQDEGKEGKGRKRREGSTPRETPANANAESSPQDTSGRAASSSSHSLEKHPLVLAYQGLLLNGGSMSDNALKSAKRKLAEIGLEKHPLFETELGTEEGACDSIQWWIDTRWSGETKPLSYMLPAIKDHLDDILGGGYASSRSEQPQPGGLSEDQVNAILEQEEREQQERWDRMSPEMKERAKAMAERSKAAYKARESGECSEVARC
jgi:hypothetical protein